jgi:3',5'-cyclic AMP phosphodiesterase CpdA
MPTTTIIHISDLHFGDASEAALKAALAAIGKIRPACVVATGDLTQAGRRGEFNAAARWFAEIRCPIVACPGNHDVPVHSVFDRLITPYHRFDRLALGQRWTAQDGDAAIETLNSSRALQARMDWSQGSYDLKAMERSVARLESQAPSGWRFLAVHHPPYAPKGAKLDSRTKHARAAMAQFGDVKRLITLAGHVHGFFVEQDTKTGMRFVTAPTLASSRGRGQTSGFLSIEIQDDLVEITRWSFNADDSGEFAPSGAAMQLLA